MAAALWEATVLRRMGTLGAGLFFVSVGPAQPSLAGSTVLWIRGNPA